MKAGTLVAERYASPFAALVFLLMLTGCASLKTDWAARVGTYTFDQAVLELGPPDKSASLSDGRQVSEWTTHFGAPRTYPFYYTIPYVSGFSLPYCPVVGAPYVESYPDTVLRLTFASDGKLQLWKVLLR